MFVKRFLLFVLGIKSKFDIDVTIGRIINSKDLFHRKIYIVHIQTIFYDLGSKSILGKYL